MTWAETTVKEEGCGGLEPFTKEVLGSLKVKSKEVMGMEVGKAVRAPKELIDGFKGIPLRNGQPVDLDDGKAFFDGSFVVGVVHNQISSSIQGVIISIRERPPCL